MNRIDTTVSGLYGKLPGLGDFLTRRLPSQFVAPWDLWLRECLTASQARLGDAWLDHYLTSPLWRFALSPGIAGQAAWVGVLMPSVDRVGRYFPFTVACALPPECEPARTLLAPDWFDRAEAVALAALEEGLDGDRVDEQVLALGAPDCGVLPVPAPPQPELGPDAPAASAWQVPCPTPAHLCQGYSALLGRALGELHFAYSLWWSSGSERVGPSLLACQGLPDPEGFVALLAGDWSGNGWLRLGSGR